MPTPFLRLNGIAVPVAVGAAELAQEDIGSSKRAADGTPLVNRRSVKRTWSGRTTIRTALEALAWRDLVTGKGHVLNWEGNSHYTSKGLAPSTVGANFTITATNPKFGTYRANSANAATNTATWSLFSATSAWSVALWASSDAGTTWAHYVVRSDAFKWVDGVRNDAASTTFMGVASGVLTLGVAAAAWAIDDVVCLPFLVPTDWPEQIHDFGYAFGSLPRLTADGLFVEQNTRTTVKGKVNGLKAFNVAAARDYHDFGFELLEV